MAHPQPIEAEAKHTKDSLINLLARADSALGLLKERASQLVSLGDPEGNGFSPGQLETLCRSLDEGRGRVHRRLLGIAGEAVRPEPAAAQNPSGNTRDPLVFLADYRACCRRLCKALSEALRISDAATGAVLSALVLRLEKQLWLMDTPRHNVGAEPYRSISLFLTC